MTQRMEKPSTSFAGSRRGLVFQWWVMPVLSHRCTECPGPTADGDLRNEQTSLLLPDFLSHRSLPSPNKPLACAKYGVQDRLYTLTTLATALLLLLLHTQSVLSWLRCSFVLWAGVWAGCGRICVLFNGGSQRVMSFFIIHYSGFRFRYLLRLFFWQMKNIVGWALGRLVECEVNMSRYFVMSESPRLL